MKTTALGILTIVATLSDAGSEIQVPRPEFNPDVPNIFWA
jgi:hypothetical protein